MVTQMLQLQKIFVILVAFLFVSPLVAEAQNPTEADYYPIIQLPIPSSAYLEVGGLEWMPNDELAVSSRRGDIYMVAGALADADKIGDAVFTKYAGGLHEVLGLSQYNGDLYATQRGEVTRLSDTDDDGRADLLETVSDGWEITGDYHEYAFGSKFDKNGEMWVVLCLTGSFNSNCKFRGWCVRVRPDGTTIATCSGIRSPGGIGMNCAGDMFYTDNQGPWNGTCGLKHLVPGSFQGHPGGNRWYEVTDAIGPRPPDPQSGSRIMTEAKKIPELMPTAVLLPYNKMGKSASGIVCDDTGGKFGPFTGQMFVGDQSASTVMRVFLEKINGRYQGVCFPFREGFGSGTLAMLMHKDGKMFVGGTNRGWGSRGNKPYALERMDWTGKVPFEIHEMRAKPDGFELTFTMPLDRKTAADLNSYKIGTYTYIYQSSYGSPEVDHTTPKIERVEVGADGRSVRLFIDKLQEGHVHELHVPGLRSESGLPVLHPVAYYTLNYIPTSPAVAAAGQPYGVPGLKFTPRNPEAQVSSTLYYRAIGEEAFRAAPITLDQQKQFTATIPAAATGRPFEYFAQFAESDQPPVHQPVDGAAAPIQVELDQQPPSPVSQLTTADVSDLALRLQWQAASDDNSVTGYRVCRSLQDAFACSDENCVGRVTDIALGWTDTAPPTGETVWYAVQAIDIAGRTGPPRYVKVDVPSNRPPENVLTLTALAAGERAFLRWSGELPADVAAVEVLRGEGAAGPLEPVKTLTEVGTRRYVDKGLKAGTLYRYAVRLVDRGRLTSEASEPELVRAGLFIKRINCGGDEVIGADAVPWEADKGRVAGTAVWTAKNTIDDAGDIQAVYQTERWSYNGLRYQFDVEPGRYAVTLHFAETNPRFAAPGKRTFDVILNGEKVHAEVDVAAQAGGNRAWQLTTSAGVADKSLLVELRKAKAGPALKGIEVRALPQTDGE